MIIFMKKPIQTLIIACLALSACSDHTTDQPAQTTTDTPTLKSTTTNAELANYLKQQLLSTYGTIRSDAYAIDIGTETSSDSSTSTSATNTQETAVDEADRLKTDGIYLYTAAINTPTINIFKANAGNPQLTNSLHLTDNNHHINGLYLHNQTLAAITETAQQAWMWDTWFAPDAWLNQQSSLHLLDISQPETPTQNTQLTFDGKIISSRRIDNTLYLATRYTPSLSGLNPYPTNETQAATNRQIIQQASLNDLLPDYTNNLDNSRHELFTAQDCFITQYSTKQSYQASLIGLIAIDLTTNTPIPQGKCFAGDTETLYASGNNLYLATTQYNYTPSSTTDSTVSNDLNYQTNISTDIHQFSLANGINYQGSGRIDGHLGWQQDLKPFRMSEYNDTLRVITYIGATATSQSTPARLHILQTNPDTQTLDTIATLPNNTHPEPLGKTGEQIYATRFLGNRAYLVTFRLTDPLYVLDLTNPNDPFIAGELQTNGYSDYLHPIGENYFLGIGKDAIVDNTNLSGDGRGAWYQGVKLSLIDVTDPANPYEKQQITIGKRGTETAVSQTHHALTTLAQGNTLQTALPIRLHTNPPTYQNGDSTYYNWTQDELYRLNIDTLNGTLTPLSPLIGNANTAQDPYAYSSTWATDRSAIIDNNVYYLHGDQLTAQPW